MHYYIYYRLSKPNKYSNTKVNIILNVVPLGHQALRVGRCSFGAFGRPTLGLRRLLPSWHSPKAGLALCQLHAGAYM